MSGLNSFRFSSKWICIALILLLAVSYVIDAADAAAGNKDGTKDGKKKRKQKKQKAAPFVPPAPPAIRTPKCKWAQNSTVLFLTVEVGCLVDENKTIHLTHEEFSLKCNDSTGQAYALEFTLREDIVPERSFCEPTGWTESCVLVKKHEHRFDRLLAESDKMKHLISFDWRKRYDVGMGDDETEEDEEPYESSSVKRLTSAKKMNEFLEKHLFVVFDVSFSWCTKCSHRRDKMSELARTMRKEAAFGFVDVREVREARAMFPATDCDYKCPLHVVRKGEKPYVVTFRHLTDELIATLRLYKRPLFTPITSEAELNTFLAENPTAVVGMFKSKDAPEAATFLEAVRELRPDNVSVGLYETTEASRIRVYKPHDEPFLDYSGNPSSFEELVRFLRIAQLPLVLEYEYNLRDRLDNVKIPTARFWNGSDAAESEAFLKVAKAVAAKFRGQLVFVRHAKDKHNYMLEDYGLLEVEKGMKFGIAESFEWNATKYGFVGLTADEESLTQFCSDFVAGKLSPSHKTELPPNEEWKPGMPKKFVFRTLESEMARVVRDNRRFLFMIMYKSYHSQSEALIPLLTDVAHALQHAPDTVIGLFDTSKNYFPPEMFDNLDSYHSEPVAYFFSPEDTAMVGKKYGKSLESPFFKYLADKIPSVKAAYETILSSFEAKVEQRKAEAEAAKAKKEAEEKAKQEKEKDETNEDAKPAAEEKQEEPKIEKEPHEEL